MVFCADSFYPNQQGRASMKSYMSILRSMYERNCRKDLVNQDDCIIPLLPRLPLLRIQPRALWYACFLRV